MASPVLALGDAGFDRKQVEALVAFVDADRVTKADFTELRGEFAGLRGEFTGLRGEFGTFKAEIRADFAKLAGEVILLRWMVGFVLAAVVALVLKGIAV